jgi:flavin reductase (DIM6/NTAB) family NADH-FMN oxidoreductase RutF
VVDPTSAPGAEQDLDLSVAELTALDAYALLTSLVVPRPIAWVSTVDADGVRNLAPHSYFNMVSSAPPIVHFTSTLPHSGGVKDSGRNARDTGEFVVNIVDVPAVTGMNATAVELPPDGDEFTWAGIEAAPSRTVRPQRVATAPAALECRVVHVLELGNGLVVFGEVTSVHLRAGLLGDDGPRVDVAALRPLARLGGTWYAPLGEPFALNRPPRPDPS